MSIMFAKPTATIDGCTNALAEFFREPSQLRLAELMSMLQGYQDWWIAERAKGQERAGAAATLAR